MNVDVKNSTAQAQRYTVQYKDSNGKLHVETFDLTASETKTFKGVDADSWKVIKVAPVTS